MGIVQQLYLSLINGLPEGWRGVVSIALAVLIIYAVFKVIKKQFIFLILLVLLLPGSIPILKAAWDSLAAAVKFLVGSR
jgi:hypothetical protein